jgi:hypothetical protein
MAWIPRRVYSVTKASPIPPRPQLEESQPGKMDKNFGGRGGAWLGTRSQERIVVLETLEILQKWNGRNEAVSRS